MIELEHMLEEGLEELTELGEVFLELHVLGRDTKHVTKAIAEVTRETRKIERKLRKAGA
jgi:hypothetical protein